MSQDAAQFVSMTCRPGAEAALKAEVGRAMPEWRPSFSRPGFLTFKNGGAKPLEVRQLAERNWTFAYTCGISLGRVAGTQLAELATQVWEHAADPVAEYARIRSADGGRILAKSATREIDLHVWQREPEAGDESELSACVTPLCGEIERAIRAAAPAPVDIERTVNERRKATPRNRLVLDVVVVEPNEWWIGCHSAVKLTERWPGGAIPVRLPPHAVSRAYAKLEEAIQWSGLPLVAGDEWVEIGCAPGGASQALLDRGMYVTGIDPAEVDPVVLEHPRFRHLKKRGGDVRRREFAGVRWLAADMNIAPDDALAEVEAIVRHPNATIRGLVLTLKFSEWSVAERVDEFVSRVRSWGYRDVRARQLVTGGQEICVVALRRKALRRLGRKRKGQRGKGSQREDSGHATLSGPHF